MRTLSRKSESGRVGLPHDLGPAALILGRAEARPSPPQSSWFAGGPKSRGRLWSDNRGFSLIEATAMVFVLTFGAMGAIQMHMTAIEKTRALQEYGAADEALQNEIEALRALPFDEIRAGNAQALYSATPALARLADAHATVDITDQSGDTPGLKQVSVKVRWTGEHGRPIERSVQTLIARKR